MVDVLVVLSYQVIDRENFENIISAFEQKGYYIHVFDSINQESFSIDILPKIIEELVIYHNQSINSICLISNVKELILAWFRCYNSLIDNFIYYIDKQVLKFQINECNDFLIALSDFNNIENEPVEGKIYLNIDFSNYQQLFLFLLRNNNYKFFDELKNFNYNKLTKTQVQKTYKYQGKILEISHKSNIKSEIDLNNFSEDFVFDGNFIGAICENTFFLKYLLDISYRYRQGNMGKLIYRLYQSIESLEQKWKRKIYDGTINYIHRSEVTFLEKQYFLFLLVLIKFKDENIIQEIMRELSLDNQFCSCHYLLIINSLFFISKNNLKIYPEYYQDRKAILEKIKNWYGDFSLGHKSYQNNNKHIAFLVDQLLAINHSPTKAIMDYALNIKQLYPEYELKIFVEDNFFYSKNEVDLPWCYSSAFSGELKEQHQKYLNNKIEVFYIEPELNKKLQTKRIIEKILEFNPEVLITTSDISIARQYLFPYFPVVFISHGGINYSSVADIYLYGDRSYAIKELAKSKLLDDPDKIQELKWGLDLPKQYKTFERKDFGLHMTDFVFITVGTRLDAEMDNDYLDQICSFLNNNTNTKWLIVGRAELEYLNENYQHLLNKQIIKINYEEDLAGLYNLCDAYLNPPRKGGGYSIAIAMNQGLPIVILDIPSDGAIYVGLENCVDSMSVYLDRMSLLIQDSSFKNKQSILMKERISTFNIHTSVNQLLKYCSDSKEKYAIRKKSL